VIAAPEEAQWGPRPPLLPPGAQIAVLAGNPGPRRPYTVRLKFPLTTLIPAHSHPTDENVVITTGRGDVRHGRQARQDVARQQDAEVGRVLSLRPRT
jgi:hypothetical protein